MLWLLEGRVEREGWRLVIDTRLSIRAITCVCTTGTTTACQCISNNTRPSQSRTLTQSTTPPPMKKSKIEEPTPKTVTFSSPHSLPFSDDLHTLHEPSESPTHGGFSFSFTVPHSSSTHITLDDIPPQKLHSSIRKFAHKVTARTKYILEFSALLDPAHAQSNQGLPRNLSIDSLSAPFLYKLASTSLHSHLDQDQHRRTVSPLHFSLSSVLDILTTLGFDVLLMQNVSADYARHLLRHADALWPAVGSSWMDEMNEKLTPEQRRGDAFMIRWEAALFAGVDEARGMGLLGRFLVVVRKP